MTLADALDRIQVLEAELGTLRTALAVALARNAELEEQLGRNSRNSSQPPSKDGPAVKRPPRGPKGQRRRGGQAGHEGRGRGLVPVAQVDEVVPCVPETCAHCGEALTGGCIGEPIRHQVTELPEPRLLTTEYQRHRRRCPRCGGETVGALPAGVSASRFGPRLHGLVAMLGGVWLLSKRQIQSLLKAPYGLDVSGGSIIGIERRVASALAAPDAAAHDHVRGSPVVHADETSWREAKRRAWLWLAATKTVYVLRIQGTRSGDAARALLGEAFAGVLCVDRWSAYTWVKGRGLCWAHLLRDFQAMAERNGSEWHGVRLVGAAQRVLAHWRDWHEGRIDRAEMLARIAPERARIQTLLQRGATGRRVPEKTRGVCRQLLAEADAMWRFLDEPDLPPTNNLAERAIRQPVRWRNGNFGTDSADGSRFVERILTAVATLKAQGRDPLAYLIEAHVAHVAGSTPPSLLPAAQLPT